MSIYNQDRTLPYCTYITFYRGDTLPPFYIGVSTTPKVLANKYHGSPTSRKWAAIYREKLKLYPERFTTILLTTHSDLREAESKEAYFQTAMNVVKNELYWNENISRVKFGSWNKGVPCPEATKKKIQKANTGRPNEKFASFRKEHISCKDTNGNYLAVTYEVWEKQRGKTLFGVNHGKSPSEETRIKNSLGNLGKPCPQRTQTEIGKKIISDMAKNTVACKDRSGNFFKIERSEWERRKGVDLFGVNKDLTKLS